MSAILLSGCSLNLPGISSEKSHEEAHPKSGQKAAEVSSKERLAKLKSENAALKKKQSESVSSSSAKAASESIAAASSSAAAESESEAANPVAKDGSTGETVRKMLIDNFGCNPEVLAEMSNSTLIEIYSDSMSRGGDISGLYMRVHDEKPNIGGDILGYSADN